MDLNKQRGLTFLRNRDSDKVFHFKIQINVSSSNNYSSNQQVG